MNGETVRFSRIYNSHHVAQYRILEVEFSLPDDNSYSEANSIHKYLIYDNDLEFLVKYNVTDCKPLQSIRDDPRFLFSCNSLICITFLP